MRLMARQEERVKMIVKNQVLLLLLSAISSFATVQARPPSLFSETAPLIPAQDRTASTPVKLNITESYKLDANSVFLPSLQEDDTTLLAAAADHWPATKALTGARRDEQARPELKLDQSERVSQFNRNKDDDDDNDDEDNSTNTSTNTGVQNNERHRVESENLDAKRGASKSETKTGAAQTIGQEQDEVLTRTRTGARTRREAMFAVINGSTGAGPSTSGHLRKRRRAVRMHSRDGGEFRRSYSSGGLYSSGAHSIRPLFGLTSWFKSDNNDHKRQLIIDEDKSSELFKAATVSGGTQLDKAAGLLDSRASQEHTNNDDDDDDDHGEQVIPIAASGGSSALNSIGQLKDDRELKCRVEKDLYLDFEDYGHYTCANCYNQVPPEYFKNKLKLVRVGERIVKLRDNEAGGQSFVWTNETDRIRATFKDGEKYEKWQICCQEALVCCRTNVKYLPGTVNSLGELIDDPGRVECPGTWDGLSCWPPSASGQLAWRDCPRVAYLLDFEPACRGYVTKQCFQNSSWLINRAGHEWSDYSTCSPEKLYKARMLHASVAYVCEALIVIPALFIIGKFPNRGGNKRIRIMKSLLFYILLNSLIQAFQRGFLAAGFFAEYRGPTRSEHHSAAALASLAAAKQQHSNSVALPANSSSLAFNQQPETLSSYLGQSNQSMKLAYNRYERSIESNSNSNDNDDDDGGDDDDVSAHIAHIFNKTTINGGAIDWAAPVAGAALTSVGKVNNVIQHPSREEAAAATGKGQRLTNINRRHKRNGSPMVLNQQQQQQQQAPTAGRGRRNESAWKAFFCWLLQMASRLVRLMGYAWMFTGGVYLCSALHFAPAEPPAKFIKILFFLTNAFPNLIFFAYVTARTINEPSPMNIVLKAPYYWLAGNETAVEHLYATQKVCWFEESKSERIEEIADMPNLILVGLNVFLFVITLVILCRINRPGSTRPDMSPCAYFRAAGTLLFLYGGHYFFLAYRPESENCSVDTIMFYAFICIDVVQGIAISIVFCYMTQEGKIVIAKFWRNRHRFVLVRQCTWMGCLEDRDKFGENGYHHTATHNNNNYNNNNSNNSRISRFNQSTRSNSGCNGNYDNVTELININDAQGSGQF